TGKPVECKNGVLTIEYEDQFKFNKDRLEKPEYRAIIQEVLAEIFREDIKIAFEVEEVSNNEKSTADMLLETLGSDMVDILDE
ncbi:MAG: DNA polymerase III subunit gamma/tau, partial [Clostridium sp.]|nr:DNA polymerase III subunit gamma/tau [Clostridium sp.]